MPSLRLAVRADEFVDCKIEAKIRHLLAPFENGQARSSDQAFARSLKIIGTIPEACRYAKKPWRVRQEVAADSASPCHFST